jgi:predicted kinase
VRIGLTTRAILLPIIFNFIIDIEEMTKLTETNSSLPRLIIVSGLPATGKTTLAQHIATYFKLPLMTKDTIKETLYDVLGCSDLEKSRHLGHASMVLLYQFAKAILQTGRSCVIESTFHPEISTFDLLSLQQRCPFMSLEILCVTETPILISRWKRRKASGERHPGHLDHLMENHVTAPSKQEQFRPLPLNGHVIELDTTYFEKIDYEQLVAYMRRILYQEERDCGDK